VIASLLLSSFLLSAPVQQVVVVEDKGHRFQLLRNGKPYYIKGAGCSVTNVASLTRLKAAGGNSVRTWGADNIGELLDEAQKHGISVTVGFWLGHVEHGFKWDNPKQLDDQYKSIQETVTKYKNHPAVLMWALGNEMEMGNNNATLWKEVGRLAKMVKSIDKNHPVTTVVAEVDQKKADFIAEHVPDLDLLGVNSYAGLMSLPGRLRDFKWKKPYIVTEFGPHGPWEVGRTPWGVSIEPTSTEKAMMYVDAYTNSIAGQKGWCLGSYTFIWGFKQEETATWFGMMLPTGENLQSVEEMTKFWSGKYPKNRSPRVEKVGFEAGNEYAVGGTIRAKVNASDPDGDPLRFEWKILEESTDKKPGGYAQAAPPEVDHVAGKADGPSVTISGIKRAGQYRLAGYIRDGKGNAATVNLPFLVK